MLRSVFVGATRVHHSPAVIEANVGREGKERIDVQLAAACAAEVGLLVECDLEDVAGAVDDVRRPLAMHEEGREARRGVGRCVYKSRVALSRRLSILCSLFSVLSLSLLFSKAFPFPPPHHFFSNPATTSLCVSTVALPLPSAFRLSL